LEIEGGGGVERKKWGAEKVVNFVVKRGVNWRRNMRLILVVKKGANQRGLK
jgi:hypothetical protein